MKLNPEAEIGDFVEQDEEIATIETDKVCPLYLPWTMGPGANRALPRRSTLQSTRQRPAPLKNIL